MNAATDLEIFTEWLLVEENPGILVLMVPAQFQLRHALHDAFELGVADQAYECCSRARSERIELG